MYVPRHVYNVDYDDSDISLKVLSFCFMPIFLIVIVLAIYGNIGLYHAKQRCTSQTTASVINVNRYDVLKSMGAYSEIITVIKYRVTYAFIDDNNEMVTFTVDWGTDNNYDEMYDVIFNPDNSSEYFFGNNGNMRYSNQVNFDEYLLYSTTPPFKYKE